jgi:ribosomal protein L11 methyltransferase
MTEPRYPTLHVRVPDAEIDDASAQLFALGATGVEERDATTLDKSYDGGTVLIAHFGTHDQASIAKGVIPWASSVVDIVGDAWRHAWREYFKPSRVGTRIVVRPPWQEADTKKGDVVVVIDPGIAFGTGTHESTRLSLAALERLVRGGETMLDVGTGSGILAIAARKLGVRSVLAIDIDPEALKAARENATRNRVRGIVTSGQPIGAVKGRYPLVVANVESRVLIPHAAELARTVAPGGTLLLAGLLAPELSEIRAAYEAEGLVLEGHDAERDWISVVLRRPAPAKTATKKPTTRKGPPEKKPAARGRAGGPRKKATTTGRKARAR